MTFGIDGEGFVRARIECKPDAIAANTPKINIIPNSILAANVDKESKNQHNIDFLNLNDEPSFDTKTNRLFGKEYKHKTELLEIAQSNLGLVEVTPQEYAKMSAADRERTQMKIVGELGGQADHQWCAYTVSYMAKHAGMNIGGSKAQVSQFVSWAQKRGTYMSIDSTPINSKNITAERANRASQIRAQLPKMHEGDFIIWKNDYAVRTENGIAQNNSSHIGIIETVNLRRGVVTVIEGNANESFDPNGPVERVEITSKNKATLGVNGNQIEEEYQEINRRDGLIRKEYTIEELANFGYSGFIDNSDIVK